MALVKVLRGSSAANVIKIAIMILALLVPVIAQTTSVSAGTQSGGTATTRSIDMADSDGGVADVVYSVTFDAATNHASGGLDGVVIDFCSNSPLPQTSCTAPVGLDTNHDDSLSIENEGDDCATAMTIDGNSTVSTLILDRTAAAFSASNTCSFELGDGTADNGIDNPTADNTTFYARIYTYDDTAGQDQENYTDTDAQDFTDFAGIAMSTGNDITVDARVQERLDFCVGTQATTTGDCTTVSGATIDLGVLDQAAVTFSANLTAPNDACDETGGTAECAFLVVTTNATDGGVIIDYRADAFDVGTTCAGGTTAGASESDQCLNPVHETAETSMVAAGEDWGIAAILVDAHASSSTTNNIVRDAVYDHGSTGFAVDDGNSSVRLAGSDGGGTAADRVVDREQVEVEIAASPAYTTPSGAYQTTLNFIATGTF